MEKLKKCLLVYVYESVNFISTFILLLVHELIQPLVAKCLEEMFQ